MEAPGGFPTSPAPTLLLPWRKSAVPLCARGLTAAPGSSGWPWDVPALVPLSQERAGPCVTASAPHEVCRHLWVLADGAEGRVQAGTEGDGRDWSGAMPVPVKMLGLPTSMALRCSDPVSLRCPHGL
ncbi:hypothetical protein RLOC_00005053 [Lonchura striata]|uniref:Uncharacterized protein n=1 Tax=Lonchura striata TaxID=40157 RepID=A0A218UD34_9PASE|nr:hypothetical protein RLOC_00005053 [Lonchura striata domestica]